MFEARVAGRSLRQKIQQGIEHAHERVMAGERVAAVDLAVTERPARDGTQAPVDRPQFGAIRN